MIDDTLKAQLSKKLVWFCKYFPVRIKNVGADAVEARRLVWAFKDARDNAFEQVAQMTASHLVAEFGERVKNMVFVCVPASTQAKNESRYKKFSERVSELCGITVCRTVSPDFHGTSAKEVIRDHSPKVRHDEIAVADARLSFHEAH